GGKQGDDPGGGTGQRHGVAGVVHHTEDGRLRRPLRGARGAEEREAEERGEARETTDAGNATAHPGQAGMGANPPRFRAGMAPPAPPPRVTVVARTERSPGSGPSSAFPVSQWHVDEVDVPVTVAGPRRIRTGFRASPFAYDVGEPRRGVDGAQERARWRARGRRRGAPPAPAAPRRGRCPARAGSGARGSR